MRARRHSSIPPMMATASEQPKSLELETRVARVELHLRELQESVDVVLKRMAALQAQLDHLAARLGLPII